MIFKKINSLNIKMLLLAKCNCCCNVNVIVNHYQSKNNQKVFFYFCHQLIKN